MTLRDEIAAIVYEAEDENLTTSMAADAIIALFRERLTSNETVSRIAESLHPMLHDEEASLITTNRRCIRAANTAITAALDVVLSDSP